MDGKPKLTRPSEVRAWIERQQFLPSKVLGQNFLIDENILKIMIDSAEIAPDDVILEVGPGLGILTEPLAERAKKVVAIEKDKRLASYLAESLIDHENIRLITADALSLSLEAVKHEHGVNKLVANLPYSVGSRVLVDCFMMVEGLDLLVVTVQLEVGERLAAGVNSEHYGMLSIWAQMDYKVKLAKRISPSCFYPRPQVTSAIVILKRTGNHRAQLKNPGVFDTLLRHAFSRRRKQMGTILTGFTVPGMTRSATQALDKAGVEPTRRPETLSVLEWSALTSALID
ncbi:MAG TPA: 16S rRNA (adenine(1518)-N(6)/adenine(1519)-N(6))-dimethyltransferase RsmA [Kiritimatiellia bacterium]|nr:16S rRNA (adenine(1518)-N(6)/adenine(1519)-N(6))-dimethyltransferase RsmA [Kiritimatiellia bacterium]